MATTAAIVVALRANSSSFRKGIAEGRESLKGFREDAKRTAEYARSLSAESTGMGGAVRQFGQAVAAAKLALVARVFKDMAGAVSEFAEASRKGEAHWTSLAERLVNSVPIVRDVYSGMKSIAGAIDPMTDTEGVRAQMDAIDKQRQAVLALSDAKKKERDDAKRDAAGKAKVKFEAGENITAGLREQLVGLMGEDDALEFRLRGVGATDAQRNTAFLLQREIGLWDSLNKRRAESKGIIESLTDAARRATMTDREYTLGKLKENEASKEQLAIAWRAMMVQKITGQLKDLEGKRPELAMESATSVGALRKGSVEAVQAERRNRGDAVKMVTYLEKMTKHEETQASLLAELKRINAEMLRLQGNGGVV